MFLWFRDVLWLNRNNDPSVAKLHWDSFLSSSLYEQKSSWGKQATSGQQQEMKESEVHWIKMVAVDIWPTSSYQHLTRRTTMKKNKNLGSFHLVDNNRGEYITEHSRKDGSQKKEEEEKSKPALFEHLMRWQTAKSALSPVVASHTSRPHSVFLHYSSDFSWARLSCPASRASGCERMHSGMWGAFTQGSTCKTRNPTMLAF